MTNESPIELPPGTSAGYLSTDPVTVALGLPDKVTICWPKYRYNPGPLAPASVEDECSMCFQPIVRSVLNEIAYKLCMDCFDREGLSRGRRIA